jgi:lactoylglutathione lyase
MKIPTTYGNNFVLNITVGDLAQEYERIKALNIGKVSEIKYINVAAPYWCFHLTDPDGNCIEIAGGYQP